MVIKGISIILATCNSAANIESCLNSVVSQDFKDYEVIIIDNASSDDTRAIIKNKFPAFTLIENSLNLGPCRARNQGISISDREFVLCLDDDVRLREGFLSSIRKAINTDPGLGAAGAKILMFDRKTIYSTGIFVSYFLRFYDIGSARVDSGEYDQKREVFGVSAAAALYRKKALESVKIDGEYFDEDFFYFFEDVDLSYRLQKNGWRSLYTPDAVCLHSGGRSRNKDRVSQYYCLCNRYFLMMKNDLGISFLRMVAIFLFYDLCRNLFVLFTNPKYFFKACRDLLKYYPKMLQKRRQKASPQSATRSEIPQAGKIRNQ